MVGPSAGATVAPAPHTPEGHPPLARGKDLADHRESRGHERAPADGLDDPKEDQGIEAPRQAAEGRSDRKYHEGPAQTRS